MLSKRHTNSLPKCLNQKDLGWQSGSGGRAPAYLSLNSSTTKKQKTQESGNWENAQRVVYT
jgi:hypothetical protein